MNFCPSENLIVSVPTIILIIALTTNMTPMEAIQAASRNAAQALDREKDVGAIAVGRFADIIAVDGNPLADVRELESVDAVIKGGKVVN